MDQAIAGKRVASVNSFPSFEVRKSAARLFHANLNGCHVIGFYHRVQHGLNLTRGHQDMAEAIPKTPVVVTGGDQVRQLFSVGWRGQPQTPVSESAPLKIGYLGNMDPFAVRITTQPLGRP